MNHLLNEFRRDYFELETRRHFLKQCSTGLGLMAMASLTGGCFSGKKETDLMANVANPMAPKMPLQPGRAKSVIYIHCAGSPSQLELFDYKPELRKVDGKACPPSFLEGKTFAFIRGVPNMLGPQGEWRQNGQSGAWVSDYLPHFRGVVDEVTFLKAMHTEQFNHAPAQLLMHTGSARLGRPSMGSWVTYGLGTENQNLPGFVVLASGGKSPDAGKSVWGSGFLPSVYQGVQCRTEGDPVLYLSDPDGVTRDLKRKTLDAIGTLNKRAYDEFRDPETLARISQYEMAYKMQMSVPEIMDIKREPKHILEMYGVNPDEGSLARNILLARRLVEQGVRFVQLFDWGWDTHGTSEDGALELGLRNKCRTVDKAMTALILDLKQRGMLDETLVVWGGEFGRTPMAENREGKANPFMGRDHHPEAFTVWMAGGGVKRGYSHGQTDEMGYAGVSGRTHVHDLQATILHCLGFDHEKFTYDFQGRPFRLTDVHGKVIREALA